MIKLAQDRKLEAHFYEVCSGLNKINQQGREPTMQRQRMLFSVLAFFFALLGHCLPQSQPAQGSLIHIEVVGLRNNNGQVSCSLYSSGDGFPKEARKALAHVVASTSEQKAVCEFPGVAPGRYAVSVYHDENSNGKLDTNFLGIPREGVGVSNNARGHMGPPKFDVAAFPFAGGRLNLTITINYL